MIECCALMLCAHIMRVQGIFPRRLKKLLKMIKIFIKRNEPGTLKREPFNYSSQYLLLDGNSLSCADLFDLGRLKYKIRLTPDSEKRVKASRALLEQIVAENKGAPSFIKLNGGGGGKQSIRHRDYSRLRDAFVERTLRLCKHHEHRAKDVHSICSTKFENKKNLLKDNFKIEQKTTLRDEFLN